MFPWTFISTNWTQGLIDDNGWGERFTSWWRERLGVCTTTCALMLLLVTRWWLQLWWWSDMVAAGLVESKVLCIPKGCSRAITCLHFVDMWYDFAAATAKKISCFLKRFSPLLVSSLNNPNGSQRVWKNSINDSMLAHALLPWLSN